VELAHIKKVFNTAIDGFKLQSGKPFAGPQKVTGSHVPKTYSLSTSDCFLFC